MRYQEPIYIQNENGCVRNKDILNVNMSSDIYVFESPKYSINGASKIDCTGATVGTSYVITGSSETIPLTFNFTANTSTFLNTNAVFRFEIYKYSDSFSGFSSTSVYKSNDIEYSTFSGTNITLQNIPSSGLTLDGEYIIKPYYSFNICTDFLSKLNKTIDTSTYISGTKYGIYDNDFDYYFIAINQAEIPNLTQNISNSTPLNKLRQQAIIPIDDQTTFNIPNIVSGDFIVTLNGLVLTSDLDYTFTGNTVFFNDKTYSTDIVTFIYSTETNDSMVGDNIEVSKFITSGATNGEGSELVYFNTTTGKYEIYASILPQIGSDMIVILNGVTLASGIDFYPSITNPKRIILEGLLMVGDLLTIVYFPITNVSMGLTTNKPTVSWFISRPPEKENGVFTLEVSSEKTFSSIYYSGTTNYQVGVSYYNISFIASGQVGTTLYYRVKNDKNYTTICGDVINSTSYSETIPIVIETNSINSY